MRKNVKKIKKIAILGALISIVGLVLMILAVTINENLAPISILVMIFGSLLVMPYRIISETEKKDE